MVAMGEGDGGGMDWKFGMSGQKLIWKINVMANCNQNRGLNQFFNNYKKKMHTYTNICTMLWVYTYLEHIIS